MRKLKDLGDKVEEELNRARVQASLVRQSANEISRTAAFSLSQSGDREHSTNQAFITEDRLVTLEKVLEELEKMETNSPQNKSTPPVYLKIELDGQEQEFYLLSSPLYLNELKIVSISSTLGHVVINKKIDDIFKYKSSEN